MLIVGAGGLACQLLDDLITTKADIVFWSETETKYSFIKKHFKILSTDAEVVKYFGTVTSQFVVGIWDIEARKRLTEKFIKLGGKLTSFVTPFNYLSLYTTVSNGCVIMNKVSSEPDVFIGEQCILNRRANFGHGCVIGAFCSIGPYSILASDVEMSEGCFVGMGAIVQPKVKIGKNVIISAGAVVTKNIQNNAVVAGVPAQVRFFRKSQ
jgi:sugar O-acyltransferase (sialic acid O-acetyltransferase NeuD family)